MRKLLIVVGFALASAGLASAHAISAVNLSLPIHDLRGATIAPAEGGIASPLGTTYNMFTGESTAQGNLALLESSTTPTADDVVNYDLLAEGINNYVAAAGGITRTVNETLVGLGGGTYKMGIHISASGDLFPAGFSVTVSGQSRPLVNAAVGIGVNLGAALGGSDPLTWPQQPNTISYARINFTNTAQAASTGDIDFLSILATPSNWNGIFALQVGGLTGAGVDAVDITMIVAKAPEPTSLSMLGLAAFALVRRRR